MARNGITKVPNLFRNVPKNRIHAPRGSARRFSLRLTFFSFMARVASSPDAVGKQKTHRPFSGGFKIWWFFVTEILHPNRRYGVGQRSSSDANKPRAVRARLRSGLPMASIEA